jgi:hypothetical protein
MVTAMSFARSLPARLLAIIAGGLLLLAMLQPSELVPDQGNAACRLESVKGLGMAFVAVRPQGPAVPQAPAFTKSWDPATAFAEQVPSHFVCVRACVASWPLLCGEFDRSPSLVGIVELRI